MHKFVCHDFCYNLIYSDPSYLQSLKISCINISDIEKQIITSNTAVTSIGSYYYIDTLANFLKMFKFFVIVASVVAFSSAGVVKQGQEHVVLEPHSEGSFSFSSFEGGFDGKGGFHGGFEGNYEGKGGNGAELSSLAHTSAAQAKNAVRSQHTAGTQAAFGVKSSLASAALGAAHAAQAALVGRQALVGNLKRQLQDAQAQLQVEIAQFQQTQAAAQAAEESSHQAQAQVNTLSAALAAAQGGAQHASQAAAEAAHAAAAQHSMVVEAKQRLNQIVAQLQGSLGELHETEAAAQKAAQSAHLAQSNAAAAGAAAVAAGSKGGYSSYGHGRNHY
ncbi:unnamed protein product [Phaedon cochleariae]|uniref:Uncharacterized protein n=1 Tax=Phaedon cochleariae TaxID=80249 RepID=A0A9N9SFK1_PHACE|nr:unnamed protein product [Phaedon cochleariae]